MWRPVLVTPLSLFLSYWQGPSNADILQQALADSGLQDRDRLNNTTQSSDGQQLSSQPNTQLSSVQPSGVQPSSLSTSNQTSQSSVPVSSQATSQVSSQPATSQTTRTTPTVTASVPAAAMLKGPGHDRPGTITTLHVHDAATGLIKKHIIRKVPNYTHISLKIFSWKIHESVKKFFQNFRKMKTLQ